NCSTVKSCLPVTAAQAGAAWRLLRYCSYWAGWQPTQFAALSFLVIVKPLWSRGSCPLHGWWQSKQFTPALLCWLMSYSWTTAEVSWRWQSAHLPVALTSAGVGRSTSIRGLLDWSRNAETTIAVLSTTAMKTPRNDIALSSLV